MIQAEDIVGDEWEEWYRMTPQERFRESEKLWETFFAPGGSLEPEPDTQSPFFDAEEWRANGGSWAARRAYYTGRLNSAAIWIC